MYDIIISSPIPARFFMYMDYITLYKCTSAGWIFTGLGFLFARLTKPIRINKDIDQPIFSWCKLTICESGCGHIDFFIGAKYVSP
jgi:hypothetical protein